MMRHLLQASLALLTICVGSPANTQTSDRIVSLRQGNAEMAAAIAKARASLPDFWRKFAHPSANENKFMLKVMMP
jgi:hypothetical protein